MSELESVSSSVKTLAKFVDEKVQFSIPSYQRPYVWSDEAIKSLFDDLYSAYINELPHYYVGTLLTTKSKHGTFELIDGQQRTTTLILLALACKKKGIDTDLTRFIYIEKETKGRKNERQLRLTFKIRDQVEAYLGHIAGLADYDNKFPSEAEVEKNPYLKRLAGGLATFENLLEQIHDVRDFANYVYEKMCIVNNQIPHSTDLNQLFATMNNSGIQLEQADILKSLLFKKISTDKATYNAIWQACEKMENYFERNVRQVFSKTQWSDLKPTDFSIFDAKRFLFKQSETNSSEELALENSNNGLSIAKIIEQTKLKSVDNGKTNNDSDDEKPEVYCNPIISFTQLLLHAYRIYLHQNEKDDFEPRFHADQLINTFKPLVDGGDEQNIKAFIECLWQVRYAFDAWVVKWVEKADEDEELLILCNVSGSYSNNNYYFNRSPSEHSELSLLQMVRHFTSDRNAQYWLTSYLGWLIQNLSADDKQVLSKLESLDNQLSLANIEQKPASYILLTCDLSEEKQEINNAQNYLDNYFNEHHGVKFRHYWFQKLEYLLRKHQSDYLSDINTNKFKQYRIISRNSVEHVHPQHEEYGKDIEEECLNSFGNLALLNVSQNSAYSNQDVAKKRIDFEAKPTFDSLKLKHIFDLMGNDKWDKGKIEQHQKAMIELLKNHYKVNSHASLPESQIDCTLGNS
ncbi:MAG: DUF262 domain-containing HNH endonuclease family protein [Methylococcaceae bacterium]